MEQTIAVLERAPTRAREAHRISETAFKHPNAFLLGPNLDVWMIGGASIVTCLLYWMFVDANASTATIAILAFNLSFVINFPHFLSSYQLLYGDYRRKILRKNSFLWAAVGAPLLIGGALVYGIAASNVHVLVFLTQAMYLSVGWHYVKQIFGVSIVASAVQKRYFGKLERNLILLNLFSVWAMSWVSGNLSVVKDDLDGISYFTLGLPSWLMTAAYFSTAVTLIAAVAIMVRKYIKTGVRPAYSSLVGFASIYFWYLPILNHPVFFYLIPFFHSLQYMLFVLALKRNQAASAASQALMPESQRGIFMKKFWGFLALATVLGALAMNFAPKELDAAFPLGAQFQCATLWFFAFNLFINLHHYFIDNVIWRGDNEALQVHLVRASQRRAHA